MKLRTALLAATAMAASAIAQPALAQPPVTGIYVGAGLGYNILQNEKAKANTTLGNTDTTVKFGGGFVGVGSVGYGFGNGLRVELQGDYYSNNINDSTAGTLASGKEQKYGLMVNALYDFYNLGLPIVPYLGAGVGYQWADWQNVTISGGGIPSPIHVNSTQGSFAYQGIAGVALPIAAMPGLALTAEYRFMGLADARKYTATEGAVSSKLKVENGYNNSFLIGARYNFGVAPPPPPPAPVAAPAPAPARTYLVFFDWDKYNLTDRAKQIIADAAQNSTKVKYTAIQVNGYTDTSGTPAYNLGLSIRRANAVKAQLITDGVPANVISIKGYGETHLLVPTGPGVREPQNRRVEIIIE
ncbi:MAG: OmpA family protein [Rhodospirillales bacterium]|nr:OmpA family protein [Rhodospirillales bacterium]